MRRVEAAKLLPLAPVAIGVLATGAAALWLWFGAGRELTLRLPGSDHSPGPAAGGAGGNPVLAGKLTRGDGQPADLPGAWPGFRGANGNGISPETVKLARAWDAAGPKPLWSVEVGEGYAGAAVHQGRVYVMDYDQAHKQDALRCLSLADGRELWRFAYPNPVKRNHGMSRTVPAVSGRRVVAMGPKCHVVCLDAATGELQWGLDLVREFGAAVPEWYAGQCPLIDDGKVILGVGGKDALLLAVALDTGKVLWQTPNPGRWKMTHSSVVPLEFAGRRQYVYCASLGVAGVAAADGALLWETTDWKIKIAAIPSPVVLEDGRLFLSGGYDAGSMLLRLKTEGERIVVEKLLKLEPQVFGATQHTPIYFGGRLYGVRPEPDGRLVCLSPEGQIAWTSAEKFGLGPFLLADGLILTLNDSGRLSLFDTDATPGKLLAQAQVLQGRESWGPMALAGGRLIVRDFTRMVCLELKQ